MSERDPKHGDTNIPSPSRLPSSQTPEELPPIMYDPDAPGPEVPASGGSKEGRQGYAPDVRRQREGDPRK